MSYKVTEVFADTNEVIEREMTLEEIAQHEKDLLEIKKKNEEKEAKQLLKSSALAKLTALGLTEDEVTGLIS